MRSEATREGETIVGGQVLYMALELSEPPWKVPFASPAGLRREPSVAARDVAALVGGSRRRSDGWGCRRRLIGGWVGAAEWVQVGDAEPTPGGRLARGAVVWRARNRIG